MSSYSFRLTTDKSPKEIYDLLLNVPEWWSGIYGETITGTSKELQDEFSFVAGGGMHSTKQKLVELIPNQKIVWQVTESNLSFLRNPQEWKGSQLIFDIIGYDGKTQVTFTHKGLKPQIECYGECSSAWTQYFHQLEEKLNAK